MQFTVKASSRTSAIGRKDHDSGEAARDVDMATSFSYSLLTVIILALSLLLLSIEATNPREP
jgi:hypothetical protein